MQGSRAAVRSGGGGAPAADLADDPPAVQVQAHALRLALLTLLAQRLLAQLLACGLQRAAATEGQTHGWGGGDWRRVPP